MGRSVAFVSFDEVPSFKGASTHILCGLRIPSRRHSLHLLTLGEHSLPLRSGLTHHSFAIKEPNLLLRGLRFRELVTKRLRAISPDLVHFRSPWEGLGIVRSGVPAIYEVNGLPSIELRYHYRGLSENAFDVFRSWEEECLLAARRIIAPSERIISCLLARYPEIRDKCTVLRNGYDPIPAHVLATATPHHAASSGETGNPLALVYLGTLTSWQGILWSLKALAPFRDRIRLDLVTPGSGRPLRALQRRVAKLGLEESVRVLSPRTRVELAAFLPKYDFGFAPFLKTERNSEQGCFPLKILDYLAHGLPVLAADLAVVRQLISAGDNGILFHPNSLLRLREAFAAILSLSPRERAALRARILPSLATQQTWDEYGAKLSHLYDTVDDHAGRSPSESTSSAPIAHRSR